jgi:hypothetical protein
MAVTERIYKYLLYQDVDRIPDLEFGYWPQTVRRWSQEGLGLDLTEEDKNQMFLAKLDNFFRFDTYGHNLPARTYMNPAFTEEVLERRGEITIMRDRAGVVSECYLSDVEQSSIPHFVSFPIKTPEDWPDMKRRYRLDDSIRIFSDNEIADARTACSAGKLITIGFGGFYARLRVLMGFEYLSFAFYDMPHLIHEIVEHWAEVCARQIEQLPEDIPVDWVSWWEDMAGKNGPLVSPAVFREFLQPGYRRVMDAAKKKGCVLSDVDCDGDPHNIVANWLEEGVNIMFPLEIQAGVDPMQWRKEFGRDLRFRGGINKYALVEGGKAVDRELERIKPLLEDGGYIPHLDHLVPPDVPYSHYCEYLDKKRKLIGR